MVSVSTATVLSMVLFIAVVPYEEYLQTSASTALGLNPRGAIQSVLVTVALMAVFYLGKRIYQFF